MRTYRIAFYELTLQAGVLYDQYSQLFDNQLFSRFKYGSAKAAALFGKQLFELIQDQIPFLLEDQNLLISASPYKSVPPASHAITHALIKNWENSSPYTTPQNTKIGRTLLFPSDYSRLDRESRSKLMQKVNLHWIHLPEKSNKKIIVVDDVFITGAHEERLTKFLEKENFEEVYFIYTAQLVSPVHPTIEHQINHASISTIWDLAQIWHQDGFILNARICKFLLAYSEINELLQFAENIPETWSREIAEGMTQDGYHQMDIYLKNWEIWERYISVPVE
ncbi:MAG: phosphoribosyltransferase family protein [Microscillaceae bacterium]|nr:phosphoribosyltransferase family protein [Microscillaceae bacterium]